MTVVFIRKAMEFNSFPVVLLIATPAPPRAQSRVDPPDPRPRA